MITISGKFRTPTAKRLSLQQTQTHITGKKVQVGLFCYVLKCTLVDNFHIYVCTSRKRAPVQLRRTWRRSMDHDSTAVKCLMLQRCWIGLVCCSWVGVLFTFRQLTAPSPESMQRCSNRVQISGWESVPHRWSIRKFVVIEMFGRTFWAGKVVIRWG